MNATESEKRIFNFLQLQNCCLRCCFRFVGWRTLDCYEDPIKYAKDVCFNYCNFLIFDLILNSFIGWVY